MSWEKEKKLGIQELMWKNSKPEDKTLACHLQSHRIILLPNPITRQSFCAIPPAPLNSTLKLDTSREFN